MEDEFLAIREGVQSVCDRFGDDYWLARDQDGVFPHEFHRAFAEAGWLGITMPEEYGGSGLGVSEASVMMHTVAKCGAMTAASSIHINMFGPHPIVVFGTGEQKAKWIPPLVKGEHKCSFGVTEPNAGLDMTSIVTFAEKVDGGWIVNGRKIWNSTAQIVDRIMLLARTTKREDVKRALVKAQNHPGPFLIDFVIEHQSNVYPMVPVGASLSETVEDPRTIIKAQP